MTESEKQDVKKLAQDCIALEQCLIRLEGNEDFKILKHHILNVEAIRLTHLLAEPSLTCSDKYLQHRKNVEECLIGVAQFAMFLRGIHQKAIIAKKDLEEIEKMETEEFQGKPLS